MERNSRFLIRAFHIPRLLSHYPWLIFCYLFNCERNLIHFSLTIVQLFLSYNNAHRDAQKAVKSYFALYDPGYLCETGFLISSRDTACEL